MPSSETAPYVTANYAVPFCKGCGHTHVLRRLSEALAKLSLHPEEVALVTDIGCIGLADGMFEPLHTVHTTHGRSTAFATGIQVADGVLGDGRLKTIVLIGDGGAMIGLQHIVNAALLNADVTVLLCNNFLFGMTGGQNSAFSPIDFLTPTTPKGNIIPPLDLCAVAAAARSEFVERVVATDRTLTDVIAGAIAHPGFALVEIVELCTEHAATRNDITGNKIVEIVKSHGQILGTIKRGGSRLPFAAAYTKRNAPVSPSEARPLPILEQKFEHRLSQQFGVLIAGSAGERVQSAAKKFCEGAIMSGLFATQKSDNPVTQGSGFSLSEVVISPHEIRYTGIDRPDAIVVVSGSGMQELRDRGSLANLPPECLVIVDDTVDVSELAGNLVRMPLRGEHGPANAALKGLEYLLQATGMFPVTALGQGKS